MLILMLLGAGICLCWVPRRIPGAAAMQHRFKPQLLGRTRRPPQLELAGDAQCLRELAALLRSGMLFEQAAQALLEVRSEPSPVLHALRGIQTNYKLEGPGALGPQQSQASSVRRLMWCLQLCSRSGAPLAGVLEQLAQDLEADVAARQSFDAAMAGPRATTKLLTWLPVIGLGAGFLLGIDVLHTLAVSPAAQLSVAGGALLWAANRIWCQRLLASTTARALS